MTKQINKLNLFTTDNVLDNVTPKKRYMCKEVREIGKMRYIVFDDNNGEEYSLHESDCTISPFTTEETAEISAIY